AAAEGETPSATAAFRIESRRSSRRGLIPTSSGSARIRVMATGGGDGSGGSVGPVAVRGAATQPAASVQRREWTAKARRREGCAKLGRVVGSGSVIYTLFAFLRAFASSR